jgi:molybdopterin biosynthesis enzyme
MVPPFDNAAMDGYDFKTKELFGVGPWYLKVVGLIA